MLDSNRQKLVFIRLQTSEDPDELQLLDECDSYWVEAWKTPPKQSNGARHLSTKATSDATSN